MAGLTALSARYSRSSRLPEVMRAHPRPSPASTSTMVARPFAGLLADANGDLFGTTDDGPADFDGTVFEIAKTPAVTPARRSPGQLRQRIRRKPEGQPDRRRQRRPVRHDLGVGKRRRHGVRDRQDRDGYASTPTTLVSFNGADGASRRQPDRRRQRRPVRHDRIGRRGRRRHCVRDRQDRRPATPARRPRWSVSTAPTAHFPRAA